MSRPQQSNIKKRLILGFCTLISIFLLFGVYSLYDIHRISQLSRIIYNHPLVVSNAALQANTSIVKMHRSMKDVVLFHSLSRIQQSIEIVNDEEERVHRQLDIVKNNILGDEGKTLENEARKLFDAWRPIRNEVIGLIHDDQRENAANITIGKGANHVALLETKMLGLLNYAKSKASEFNFETERIVSMSNILGIFLLLLGTLVSILVAFTILKRTSLIEKKLIESEEQYRRLFETANDAILLVEKSEGKIVRANPSVSAMFGYPEEECIERKMKDIGFPDEFDNIEEILQILSKKDIIHYKDVPLLKKDGQAFDTEIYMVNKASFIQCNVRDITEKKREEEALRESEERYRAFFEKGPDGVVVLEPETAQIIEFNDRACRQLGYSREEFALLRVPDIEVKETAEDTHARIRQVLAKGHDDFETLQRTKQGEIRHVQVTAQVIEVAGKVVYHCIWRDITERVSLQAQLVQAQKMESVGRLAGGVAHDYNNALSVIIGFTELTIDGVDPSGPLRANLEEVLAAATRAKDITRQLLAFARKQTIAPKVLDLNDNVEDMLKMLRHLIGEDIDLAWLPATNLWPIKMDPSQIDQILANLCVNARDAIGGVGKIAIGTDTVVFDTDYCAGHVGFVSGEFVMLTVSDNGCGIDKEILNQIFEPFFTTKDVDKGAGLGLAMVYGIVKQNNGFINVYSEPGKGTTIKIYLPRNEVEVVEIHEESKLEILPGRGETVLLVEDQLSVLKLTQKILDNLGYTTLTAGTPVEALGLAEEHAGKIHLLVTDVIMPEMNGHELAERLRSLYPDLKYMFMSGYTANAISHRNILDKGVHFIQKPFSKRDLATTVRDALDEGKRLI